MESGEARAVPTKSGPLGTSGEPRGLRRAYGEGSYGKHMKMGLALLRKAPSRAIAHFQYALNERPNSVEALYGVGACLLKLGSPRQAMGYFQKALRVVRDHGPSLIGMARAQEALGDSVAAKYFYKRYLSTQPFGSMAKEARRALDRLTR